MFDGHGAGVDTEAGPDVRRVGGAPAVGVVPTSPGRAGRVSPAGAATGCVPESRRDSDDARLYVDQPGGVVAGLVAQLADLDDDALVGRAQELAGVISTAEASLALVAAELERRTVPSQWECRTIERFAGWHLELSPTRAR